MGEGEDMTFTKTILHQDNARLANGHRGANDLGNVVHVREGFERNYQVVEFVAVRNSFRDGPND